MASVNRFARVDLGRLKWPLDQYRTDKTHPQSQARCMSPATAVWISRGCPVRRPPSLQRSETIGSNSEARPGTDPPSTRVAPVATWGVKPDGTEETRAAGCCDRRVMAGTSIFTPAPRWLAVLEREAHPAGRGTKKAPNGAWMLVEQDAACRSAPVAGVIAPGLGPRRRTGLGPARRTEACGSQSSREDRRSCASRPCLGCNPRLGRKRRPHRR